MKTASWIIRNKLTKEVIAETFDPRKVAALNKSKYEAVPILEYLGELNKRIKAESRQKNPAKRRRNPVGGERLEFLKKGVELYRDFSGHVGEYEVHKLKLPNWPKELVAIGECDFIGYTTVRDGEVEKYKHDFRKSSRPLLCTTPDGRQLYLVGGAFQFTDRGIVDK